MEFINYTTYEKAEDIKRLKFIMSSLAVKNNGTLQVLEVGCGNGNISYQLARSGYTVTGIDISETTIKAAQQRFGSTAGLRFMVADAEQLLPTGGRFDAIICSEVLEHLYEPDKLVAKFRSMLKPDGIAVVTVPNGYGPRELLVTQPTQKILTGNTWVAKLFAWGKQQLGYRGNNKQTSAAHLDHIQFFTLKRLEQLAHNGGFAITQKKAGNFVENVFPLSLISRRSMWFQKLDCAVADKLPLPLTGAFYSVWEQQPS